MLVDQSQALRLLYQLSHFLSPRWDDLVCFFVYFDLGISLTRPMEHRDIWDIVFVSAPMSPYASKHHETVSPTCCRKDNLEFGFTQDEFHPFFLSL